MQKFEDFQAYDTMESNYMAENFSNLQENLKNNNKSGEKDFPYYVLEDNTPKKYISKLSDSDYQKVGEYIFNQENKLNNINNLFTILIKNTPNLSNKQLHIDTLKEYFQLNKENENYIKCFQLLSQGKTKDSTLTCKLPPQLYTKDTKQTDQLPPQLYTKDTNQTDQLKDMITQQQGNISSMMEKISNKDDELQNKMERSVLQQREIEYKKKLVDTRNRMLQLSQDKNVYKGKVIYTLLASIILITVVLLAIYIYFMRK